MPQDPALQNPQDLPQAPKEDSNLTPEQWKEIAKERIGSLKKERERREALEQQLSKYQQSDSERIAREQENQEKAQREDAEKRKAYEEALKLKDQSFQKEKANFHSTAAKKVIPSLIKSALLNTPVIPSALADITGFLQGQIGLQENTLEPYIKGEDGKPLLDAHMKPVAPDQFIQSYIEARPWLKGDKLIPGTNTQPNVKSPTGGTQFTAEAAMNNRKLLLEWQTSDPVGCKAAIDQYLYDQRMKNVK